VTGSRASRDSVTGTGILVRLALRRDRIVLPAWVLSLAFVVTATGSSLAAFYPTAADRASLAASLAANGSLRALYGQVYATGIGGLTAWRIGSFAAAGGALMGLLLTVRHTREEEEEGRLELLGAGRVGRRAPLTAALVTAGTASAALALLVALGLLAQGAAGALAFGLGLGAASFVFAAVAAVAAQLTETARAARGIAGAVLGLSYMLRATGDAAGPHGPGWLVWLSPLGWAEQIRPYAGDRWWVLAALAGIAVLLVGAAYALVERRDLGAALLATRPGPAEMGPRLRGVFGLAWRLQRGSLWSWTFGYAVAGAVLGSITQGAADLVRGNPQLEQAMARLGGAKGLTDAFAATMVATLGMVAAVYAVQAVLRLRAEEDSGRAEPVLATAVGRLRWAASHLCVAAGGSVLLMTVGGLTLGLGYGVSVQVPRMLGAALVQLPAIAAVAGVAVLLHGAAPRLALASWSAVSLTIALGLYGPLLRLSHWLIDLSAFTHLPKVPAAPVTAPPLLWLTGLAAVLTAAGLAALRRRDIG
jgi:ABC-2 type transport system permease protein